MKKVKSIVLALLLMLPAVFGYTAAAAEKPEQKTPGDYEVSGGQVCYDFDSTADLSRNFNVYAEFSTQPYVLESKLFFNPRFENKVILKKHIFTEFDISADLSALVHSEKIDMGFYFGVDPNRDVRQNLDGISAYCITFEKGRFKNFYSVKIHRFDYSYQGIVAQVENIPYEEDQVHFRVVYKGDTVYAFVNHGQEPVFSYQIGEVSGMLGVRNFCCSNTVDNLKITAPVFDVDLSTLNQFLDAARAVPDIYTQASRAVLAEAISFAETVAAEQPLSSYRIYDAIRELEYALETLVERHTGEELAEQLSVAAALRNPEGKRYTKNSWASLQYVISLCQGLGETASEADISHHCNLLTSAMENLIAYDRGDAV